MSRFLAFAFLLLPLALAGGNFAGWPTESDAFDGGGTYESFIQGTAGHPPSSGLFGDVRNNGYRFHEGIDIKSVRRDKKREPLDEVRAAMDGKIVHINRVGGRSGYGKYVVMEHPDANVPVYTLYAHMAEVEESLKVSDRVGRGGRLGRMGHTAMYKIGKDQAHLHFEIGLRLCDDFDRWYSKQKFKEKNHFGNYNGMNLFGMDPLAFLTADRDGDFNGDFAEYIRRQPTAFVVRFYTAKTPDFVLRYPALADARGLKCGWDIHFTWFGMPKTFERIKNPRIGAKDGEYEIVGYDPAEIRRKARVHIVEDSKGGLKATRLLESTLEKMF